jgi:hypothetical protein
LWRWLWHEGRFAVLGGCADIAYIIGKKYGPGSLWQAELYRPRLSVATYFHSLSAYLRQLIYIPVAISSWQIAVLLVAMLAVAVVSRRRCLMWGLGFIVIGVLPLAFIARRNGFAYMIPAVGWAVYGSGLLDWLLELVTGSRVRLRRAVQAISIVALFVALAHWQRVSIRTGAYHAHDEQARYRRYIGQIGALIPAPRKGARILLLSDAEGRDDYDVFFVIRLYYGDPSLEVQRMTVWRQNHVRVDLRTYDYVLDWVDNRFVLVSHTNSPPS